MGGSSAPAVHLSAAAPTEKDTPCAASCPREVSGRPAGAARTRSVHGVGVRRAAPGPRNGWNECTWRSLRAGFGSPRLPTAATPRPTPRRRPTSCPDEFGGSPRTPNLNGGGYQRPHAPPPHPARACGSRWYSTDTSTPLQTAIHRSGTVFKASVARAGRWMSGGDAQKTCSPEQRTYVTSQQTVPSSRLGPGLPASRRECLSR